MAENTTDRTRLVATTANRLRLIQVDFADDTAEARAGYLAEEVQRALNKLAPDQREPFLEDLRQRFPTWEARVDLAAAPAQASPAPASPMDARELRDPSFLVTRLTELAPGLLPEQKRALAARLAEAGLAAAGGGPDWPAPALKALKAKLGLPDGDNLDAARTLEVLTELVALALSLDQLAWSTWKQIAPPNTGVRKQTVLQRTLARYAVGDQDIARANVTQDVEKLRQLTASLVAAIGQIGRQFMQRHLHKFTPDEIKAIVQSEKGGGLFANEEVKCWRKYLELARTLDEANVESEIRKAVAEYAEGLIKGLSR